MASEKVGVQARICTISPLALYTHCRSHVLNLSIASACTIPIIRNMIGVINEVFLFFGASPKRQNYFEHVLDTFECQHEKTKVKGLCKTRWIERHTCFESFYELHSYLCNCFELIANHMHIQIWTWRGPGHGMLRLK